MTTIGRVYRGDQAFGGNTDWQLPGETGGQYNKRIQAEFDARGGQQLGRGQDFLVNQVGNPNVGGNLAGGGYGGGGGASGGGAAGGGTTGANAVANQRNLAFGALDQHRNIFNSNAANGAQVSAYNQMQGQNVPFTQGVVSNLFADATDGAAAATRNANELIRQQFARAGMGSGGGQLQALLNQGREYNRDVTQAQRQIGTTAALENFSATERGRQSLVDFLNSKSASQLPATLEETRLRSQMEFTNPGSNFSTVGGANVGGFTPLGISGSVTGRPQMGLDLSGYSSAMPQQDRSGLNYSTLGQQNPTQPSADTRALIDSINEAASPGGPVRSNTEATQAGSGDLFNSMFSQYGPDGQPRIPTLPLPTGSVVANGPGAPPDPFSIYSGYALTGTQPEPIPAGTTEMARPVHPGAVPDPFSIYSGYPMTYPPTGFLRGTIGG